MDNNSVCEECGAKPGVPCDRYCPARLMAEEHDIPSCYTELCPCCGETECNA